jgi:hypothetical protein
VRSTLAAMSRGAVTILDPVEVRLRNVEAARASNRETRSVARALRRDPPLRALVFSVAQRPDQSTHWWFDQELLAVLSAAHADVRFVTNASYALDERRFTELGTTPRRFAIGTAEAATAIGSPVDVVLALTPSAPAVDAAHALDARLGVFAIKAHEGTLPTTMRAPPPRSKLFHAFAGSRNADGWMSIALGGTRGGYEEHGAPFPVARFYFPASPAAPTYDALLFGSKDRDLALGFAAMKAAGVERAIAIANEVDVAHVTELAASVALPTVVHGPLGHTALRDALCAAKVVVNPIVPPSESHYSSSVPLAVARPIVTTQCDAMRPYLIDGGGIVGVPAHATDAWALAIRQTLADFDAMSARAFRQCTERHDMGRFFASAITLTLGG